MRMRFDCGSTVQARVRGPHLPHPVIPALALMLALSGCSNSAPSFGSSSSSVDPKWGVSSSKRVIVSGPIPKGGGHYKLGRAYQVGGRWYVPRHEPYYDRTGVGSWYGKEFHGRKTANGEIFDMDALTAAHPTLPMPSYAYVTNLRNGRTILVRINDRGPYVVDREIDLSRASANALGYASAGLGKVRVRWAGHAPMDGNDRREQAYLRGQTGGPEYQTSDRGYDRGYDGRPQNRGYAQDWQRPRDPYDAPSRAPAPANDAYRPPREDRYSDDDYAQGAEQLEHVRPSRQSANRGYDNTAQSANRGYDNTAQYAEPVEPRTPAADDVWSPFAHREQIQTTRRK